MDIQIMKLSKTAKIPTRGSVDAAGYDLYADMSNVSEDKVVVRPGDSFKVSTGIAMAIPKGYFGGIYARSGLAIKNGIRPSNCVGVIDSDYRNDIIVSLYNDSDEDFVIEKGMRVAQIIIQKFEDIAFNVVDKLDSTDRGLGGLGSTGLK